MAKRTINGTKSSTDNGVENPMSIRLPRQVKLCLMDDAERKHRSMSAQLVTLLEGIYRLNDEAIAECRRLLDTAEHKIADESQHPSASTT